MKENKQEALLEFAQNYKHPEEKLCYEKDGETFEVQLKLNVSLREMGAIIRDFLDFCFDTKMETIEDYYPHSKEFARRFSILSNVTDLEFPDDVEEIWQIVMNTPIFDDVRKCDVGLFAVIDAAMAEAVEVRKRYLENKTDFNKFLAKVEDSLSEGVEQINPDDIKKLIETFKNMPMPKSQEDIVNSILKAQNVIDKKTN